MKKACIVLISIIIVGICVFCGYKLLQSFVLLEPTVLQQVESSDGKYTAYVFHCEGTRERFTYRLSIIESDKKLKSLPVDGKIILEQTVVELLRIAGGCHA
jgi:hypothetical protein